MKIGDKAYIIRNHIKNHKNIGYYVDNVTICEAYLKDYNSKYVWVRLENKERRRYLKHRIYQDYKKALEECEFKNKEKQLRDDYNKRKELLRRKNV